MGATDTKSITSQIDSNFRSLRKYHDPFYGQLTLLQSKSTHQQYALIQKIIIGPDSTLSQFLDLRKQHNPYLVRLHEYYSCSIDYCSGLEKYFFLLEYSEHTLYREMTQRHEREQIWGVGQLWNIFANYEELLAVLKDPKSGTFRSFVSNHFILYDSSHSLKTLQYVLKVQAETFQHDFHIIKHNQCPKRLYLSPQSYTLLCNKQKFQAKTLSLTQKSIIFMLGMNFLECALLADISGAYNQYKRCVEFDLVEKALNELGNLYGEEICLLVEGMLAKSQEERWGVEDIKQYIRVNGKRRKITVPRHTKIQHLKAKQLKV